MDLKEIKEVVSIALAVIIEGNDLEDQAPIDVHELHRRASQIQHRIELVLQHRAGLDALYD